MDAEPGVNKASGIPRPPTSRLPTRLPTLQPRVSQVSPSKKDSQPAVAPCAPAKTATSQKRSLATSTLRPNHSSTSHAASFGSSLSQSTASKNGLFTPRASTSSKASSARPESRATSMRSSVSAGPTSSTLDDDEHHDRLGTLDSFRSASRQGFYDERPPEDFAGPEPTAAPPKDRKTSRPSLSERTIESLQNMPSTPKVRRRQSDFFSPAESPMPPPPRPGSTISRPGSKAGSRPTTSDGTFASQVGRPASPIKYAPASAGPTTRTGAGGLGFMPAGSQGRRVSGALSSSLGPGRGTVTPSRRAPSPYKMQPPTSLHNSLRSSQGPVASNPAATRPARPKPATADAFGSTIVGDSSSRASSAASPSSQSAADSFSSASAALRQQIAAAKAAARREKVKHDSPQASGSSLRHAPDIESHSDPFNQGPRDPQHILRTRIKNARVDGRLNIAALDLTQIPDDVLDMYSPAAMAAASVNWAEVVHLARLNAADNNIAEIGEQMFPDKTMQEFEQEELNHEFGGLEGIDFHGNSLIVLPLGLRRLERLTTLNLAHNKLDMSAIDVISQIASLKDLKLGHNTLSGNLPASICQLENLESLDLQSNRLLTLPEAVRELVSLKTLNVSGNQLTALPMDALQELNLTDLDASNNALIGSVFTLGGTAGHPTIQTLRVVNNSLAALIFSDVVDMPRLRVLDVTNNHLTMLPSASSFPELVTLAAGDNKLSEVPVGFASLKKLKSANFSGNDLRQLDPEIGTMEGLDHLIITSNPLREKRFLTMSAQDIKRDLMTRLETIEADTWTNAEIDGGKRLADSTSSSSPTWALSDSGVLDLSQKALADSVNDDLASYLQRHEVKGLILHSNKLTKMPPALWLGHSIRFLDFTANSLSFDYLSDELALPALQELIVARCNIKTLDPLLTHLRAPQLSTLNLTGNRLSGALPALRATYPELRTLLAADNGFTALPPAALRGLHTASLTNNAITHLPPEIGLLWDEELRHLDVGGNVFRVPNYRILDKGTDATLRWLRDRLPTAAAASSVADN